MTLPRCLSIAAPMVLLCLALSLSSAASPAAKTLDPPIEFAPKGAATPEIAATTLFRACTARSPNHFTQHLLLGVCDGPIASVNKYAEALHTTTYTNGKDDYTVYELPKMMKKDTERVLAIQAFADDAEKSLEIQGVSTYYANKFSCVDVAGEGYDGAEYRTRIVVAMLNGRWYAIPRCRSSTSFYQVADAMDIASPEPRAAK